MITADNWDTWDEIGGILKTYHRDFVWDIVDGQEADVVICAQDHPYLIRWYLMPRNTAFGNLYLHVQLHDDIGRDLHDHPWNYQSKILAGGYKETIFDGRVYPHLSMPAVGQCIHQPGSFVSRSATDFHRLELLSDYSISLFQTGRKIREWGFQTDKGWVHHEEWERQHPEHYTIYPNGE